MESWEKLTNPEILRNSLMSASVYLSAYEMCRDFIVSKPKGFFTDYCGEDGEKLSDEYDEDVLCHSKSPLKASLKWFENLGAIDSNDIALFDAAREHRNDIAHNLPNYISDPDFSVNQEIFNSLLIVTHKIGVYWVVNFEMALNPDYSGHEINESEIKIGTLLMIDMTMQIAFGEEPEEGYYYKEMKRRTAPNKPV
ncbi:hypothetical protein [Shewanella algae]|uniref:hypothetical protein n=1 Tax=Shewanella algae TaxID=38313 RepID=UPI001AAD3872|nr:hypothetical protein [Shewanella algae]MBO2565572.1 hypothetical protein [Shewanella algae]